ncbi:MAG: hypothetical protein ACO1OG_08010 [Devosia sp.]
MPILSSDRRQVIDDVVEALRGSTTEARALKAMDTIEDRLTPLELQELGPQLTTFGGHAEKAVASARTLDLLTREAAQPYLAFDVAPTVVQFSADPTERQQRSAVLVFCAMSSRPLLPISLLVQLFPADRYDLFVIWDPSRLAFRAGVPGLGNSVGSMVDALATLARLSEYRSIYTLGTSMGGVPALRAGLQLGAKRSVSVGGAMFWQLADLFRTPDAPTDGYDLCVCQTKPGADLVCVYAGAAFSDVAAAMQIGHIAPATLRPVRRCAAHNVMYELYQRGSLRHLLGKLFDFAGRPTQPRRTLTWFERIENLTGAQYWPGRLTGLPSPSKFGIKPN